MLAALKHSRASDSSIFDRCKGITSQIFNSNNKIAKKIRPTPVQEIKMIKTLDQLLKAFIQGFIPNLSDPSQRSAFEIYRTMKFGDPNTTLYHRTTDRVAEILNHYPELGKEPFRNFQIQAHRKVYPLTNELAEFTNSQTKSAGQIRGQLFQIEANRGYWKKVLDYRRPGGLEEEEARRHYLEFIQEKFPQELRQMLKNKETPAKTKAKALYQHLMEERRRLKKEGTDVRPISQAIADLIHTIGYHDMATVSGLKSDDGMERLNAFRKMLEERDSFALELEYEGHYAQVLRELEVAQPTGLPVGEQGLAGQLRRLEDQLGQGTQGDEVASFTQTVRHLTLVESPWRSCLGGSDCSTNEYLSKALDPNYHYFTLTDEEGASSGHITIVLGEAIGNAGGKIKVAFVDKVQNVSNTELPTMLEGVRRSVEEKGYRLAISPDQGGHNGISNSGLTRQFIGEKIELDQSEVLAEFAPHPHQYNFPDGHSRAGRNLKLRMVIPLQSAKGRGEWEIFPGELAFPWKMSSSSFDLESIIAATIDLKHGDLEDKLHYVASMHALKKAGRSADASFESTIQQWLEDQGAPFKLRKRALIYQRFEAEKRMALLPSQLEFFALKDRVVILQNLLDTPRYKRRILLASDLYRLIVKVRKNKNIRDRLLRYYAHSPHQRQVMVQVLEAEDISDEVAVSALQAIPKSFDSPQTHDASNLIRLLETSRLSEFIQDELARNLAERNYGNAALGRWLALTLESTDEAILRLGEKAIALATSPNNAPIAGVYAKLMELHRQSGAKSLGQVAEEWIGREEGDIASKAEFLKTLIGSERGEFERYLELLPKSQHTAVWKEIDGETFFGVFRNLAQGKERKELLDRGILESFEFRRGEHFPSGGPDGAKTFKMGETGKTEVTLTQRFEVQATLVTQLQYFLVMRKNPSRFDEEGVGVYLSRALGDDLIYIDPNRPVEQVSWEDAQQFVEKLNQLQKEYIYRLPTEAEWEFVARGGTEEAKYFFGDSEKELPRYAWFAQNSDNRTHKVAQLCPNPFGLYDICGNLWEWTQDRYSFLFPEKATDPTGTIFGKKRVARGGGWSDYNTHNLHSAHRSSHGPYHRASNIGFRLFRTPVRP